MSAVASLAAIPTVGRRLSAGWLPYVLIAPTFLALVVVSLVPFLYAVYLSFHEVNFGQVGELNGFGNYLKLFGYDRFWNSLWVATKFTLIAVPIEFVLGLGGALVLNQRVWGRSVLLPLLFIPSMMAPIVVGLLWKIMLAGSWGLLSYNVLERFDLLPGQSVFASADYALYALILVDVWQWTPFVALAFFAGLQGLPVGPYRAASVDGASSFQQFTRLTLPMMTPLLAVIGLIRFIDAFKIFDSIFILTTGGPGVSTESPSILGYKMSFEQWRIGESAAMAVMVWIAFFVLCSVFYHVAKRRLKAF